MDKEQIIIDTNKYFVELIDEGGGTVGYTVVHPEQLLREIIKQNKQLARKTQECIKLNNKIIDMNSIIEDAAINLGNKDFTLYDLPFEIKKLRQECKESKAYTQRQENQRETYYKEFLKKAKALEEIKLLVTNIISSCDKCPDNKNGYCIGIDECSNKCFKKLLNIINKVKGEKKCQ